MYFYIPSSLHGVGGYRNQNTMNNIPVEHRYTLSANERELTSLEESTLEHYFFKETESGMMSNKDNFEQRFDRFLESLSWSEIDSIMQSYE